MVGPFLQAAATPATQSLETLLLPQAAAFPACARRSLRLPLPFTAGGQKNSLVRKAALWRALLGCPPSPFKTADHRLLVVLQAVSEREGLPTRKYLGKVGPSDSAELCQWTPLDLTC